MDRIAGALQGSPRLSIGTERTHPRILQSYGRNASLSEYGHTGALQYDLRRPHIHQKISLRDPRTHGLPLDRTSSVPAAYRIYGDGKRTGRSDREITNRGITVAKVSIRREKRSTG